MNLLFMIDTLIGFAEIWVMWIDCILDEGNHSTSLQIKLKRKTRRTKLKAEVESLIVISY